MSTESHTKAATATVAGVGAASFSGEALAQLSPKSTGSPGPGDYAGAATPNLIDFKLTGLQGTETFETFGCKVFKTDILTPDWATANVYFVRDIFTDQSMTMPDGKSIQFWGFEDPLKAKGIRKFPSPLIRVQEGDLVHVKLKTSAGQHTIHHHGVEPTTMNDGVGHVSFETSGEYIYQWQPAQAGTFFYHCHINTVLHFEMGLYGLLIVDPKPVNGKVAAYKDGPNYDVERFWVIDDMDPRWHTLEKDAGICGEDAGLNRFEPKYFFINGVATRPGVPTTSQSVVAQPGKKILIRLLNASYSVLKVTFEGLETQIISIDGHPLDKPWNSWIKHAPNQPMYLATATRYDILIDTTNTLPGTRNVHFEFQHWITRKQHNLGDAVYAGKAFTTITV